MKIKIICVGKIKEKYLKDAIDEYKKRLSRFAQIEIAELNDEKIPDNPSQAQIDIVLKKEGDKILEKIAEECGETLIASKNDENLVYESVDLIFHTLLLLVYKGVPYDEILEEFDRRRK